jgi:putative transposase
VENRTTIRYKNWDYTHPGAYFITICTKNKECFFGEIINRKLKISKIGRIAEEYLIAIPNHFLHVIVAQCVVMPNHIHLILYLKRIAGTSHGVSLPDDMEDNIEPCHGMALPDCMEDDVGTRHVVSTHPSHNEFGKPIKGSVSVIINQFKSSVKRWCNKNNHSHFEWQSRFHEHFIRNDEEYSRIRDYIYSNPSKWEIDMFYKAKELSQGPK